MGRGLLLLLAVLTGTACRHVSAPGPADGPVTLPTATPHAPPAEPDPCAPDCRTLAEATLAHDAVKGLRLLRACMQCGPKTPGDFARLADLERSAGDTQTALQTLRAGTREHADSGLLWQLRGRLALDLGDVKEGLMALTQARSLQPDNELLGAELQDAVQKHGEDEARARVEVSSYIEEAAAAFARQALDEAKAVLKTALSRTEGAPKTRADILQRLALVCIAQGQLPEARKHLQDALQDVPDRGAQRADLLVTLSDVLIAQDDAAGALISASAAAEMNPRDPLAHANVALSRALRKQWRPALAALKVAIDRGLPSRLTREELLSLRGFVAMGKNADFKALVNEGWPAQ